MRFSETHTGLQVRRKRLGGSWLNPLMWEMAAAKIRAPCSLRRDPAVAKNS
jgi:hypothetical protein